jgi:hypothetical protein
MSLRLHRAEVVNKRERQSPNSGEARMYAHVVTPSIWDKMEHLGELQWVRAVVDLDGYDGVMRRNQNPKSPGGYLPRASQSRSR